MRSFNVKVNGKVYNVEVEEANGASSVSSIAPAASAPVKAAAPAPAVKMEVPAGGTTVVAPLPGLVLKLVVANGATVKKDQKILVLEAMKMENDIVAACDGTIHFAVKEGDTVETGATLASIK